MMAVVVSTFDLAMLSPTAVRSETKPTNCLQLAALTAISSALRFRFSIRQTSATIPERDHQRGRRRERHLLFQRVGHQSRVCVERCGKGALDWYERQDAVEGRARSGVIVLRTKRSDVVPERRKVPSPCALPSARRCRRCTTTRTGYIRCRFQGAGLKVP